jgi:hypothetical protein
MHLIFYYQPKITIRKKYIIILAAIIIACGSISAQSFTKVSIGPIVSDSSNTFDAAQGDCIGRCPDNDKSATIIANDNISIFHNNQNRTVEINSTTEKAQAIFEIYDYSGRLILSKPLGYLQQGTTIINVQNLSRGIYLGVIKTKSEYATTKIIQL